MYIFIHKLLPEHSYNYFVYTIVSVHVRIVTGRHCVSSRPFLCIWNMYYYQQRCVNKIYPPSFLYHLQPHLRYVRPPKRNGGLYPAAIYNFYAIYIHTNNGVYIKYRSPRPQIFAAIRFSPHSMTKSKISISCIGKSGRRYGWRLQYHTF